jgi:glycosyltransferase involved in cell wall biosynthesis
LKIAYLSDSTIPSKKANSVHVMQMCDAFQKNGHEVLLTAFKGDGNHVSTIYGTDKFQIVFSKKPLPKVGLWMHAFKSRKVLKEFKPDLVFGRSLFSCCLAAFGGYKVCYETHNPISSLDPIRKWSFKSLCTSKNFRGLVTMSNALKNRLLGEQEYLSSERILAIHDGAKIYNTKESSLQSYTWPSNPERTQVGYVGTISKGRGLEILVGLSKSFKEVDFHIIGGEASDMEKINLSEESLKELSNLYFHGFIKPAEAILARKKCDILLAPYQENVTIASGNNTASYMSPLKIFEYMEAKKPIIASDLPVLKEVLHQHNCLFAQSNNQNDWEIQLQKLIDDLPLGKRLANKAFEDLQSKYTWVSRAKNIVSSIT